MRLRLAIEQLTRNGCTTPAFSGRTFPGATSKPPMRRRIAPPRFAASASEAGTDVQPLPGDRLREFCSPEQARRGANGLTAWISELKILRRRTTGIQPPLCNGSCGDHLTVGHCAAWPLRPHGRLWSVRRAITPRVAETAGVVVGAMVSHSGIVGAVALEHTCLDSTARRWANRLMPRYVGDQLAGYSDYFDV